MKDVFQRLTLIKIAGDGNCLFSAVGIYLYKSPEDLRQKVAKYMEANANEFSSFYAESGKTFVEHIADIRAGQWGTHIEIEVIQRITRSPIIILRPDANPTIPDTLWLYPYPPIFVYYNGENHYDAFFIRGNNDSRAILARIQDEMKLGKDLSYVPEAAYICPNIYEAPTSEPLLHLRQKGSGQVTFTSVTGHARASSSSSSRLNLGSNGYTNPGVKLANKLLTYLKI